MSKKSMTVFCQRFGASELNKLYDLIKKYSLDILGGIDQRIQFIALTPLACAQLDAINYNYKAPEDYLLVEDIEFNPSILKNNMDRINYIYKYEEERALNYWTKFINLYIEQNIDNTVFICFKLKHKGSILFDAIKNHKRFCKKNIFYYK